MPTTITLSRTTQLLVDNDGDNVADSGDIIRTFLHLTNTGAQDALNLVVNDNFTGSTLVPGSVKITPIAFDDSYTGVTGNTPITYAVNQGVLANDFDPDGAGGNAGLTVTKVNGTVIGSTISISGGTVDMAADGHFTFTPTTGFNGTATFNYTIQDAQGLNNVTTGTVNIQVNGGMIWYVDNTASAVGQDGSYLHPFQQLTQLNGLTGDGTTNDDVDGAGDTIFVYHNGGAYTAGITLEAGQTLLGDGQSLLVNGHNIGGTERTGGVDNVATNSVINNAGANGGITLSTDNVIKGLDVNGTANGAIGIQDGNSAVSTGLNQLVISNVALTGQGQLIDIDQGGKASISLNSLASSGSTGANGGVVDLTGLTTGSAVTVTGTTSITGTHAQTGIDISGNSGITVNFQGNVTVNTSANSSNALVMDTNTGTNTITFGGSANTFTTAAGNAVEMTGNTTATTVNFNNGGLNIDTTTGTGLNVGATTINIAGAANTIDTTTGQILIATNAAVGGSNLAFATLTSTGATTGNAIDINNLDNGSFTSGGVTIANTGSGFDAIHIVGGSSTNFAFNGNTDINGVGANGDGVELNGANGTVSFANLTVDGMAAGTGNGLLINGATNTVTVSGAIGTGSNTGDAVNVTGGTAAVTINANIAKNVAGNIAEVNGHATGAISFGGTFNASGTAAGINLVNNTSGTIGFTNATMNLNTGANTALNFTNTAGTGAAVTFSGGTLNIDTTSGAGINATSTTTGAGSLTISGANNTVDVTGGGAGIKIDGVTETVTLLHANIAGGSNTGIFLQNAGSGGFTITGSGTTAGTGGILNFSAAGANGSTSQGIGVYLNNVGNVSLADMNFTGTFSNFGIRGDTVNNFTLKDSNLSGVGNNFGDSNTGGVDEGTIRFGTEGSTTVNGLTGTGSFLGNTIANGSHDNLGIFNGTAGTLTLSITDTAAHQAVIGDTQGGVLGNIGVQLQSGGSAGGQGGGSTLNATINSVDFQGAHGDLLSIVANQHTTQNLTITNNNFINTDTNSVGGGVSLASSAAADTNYVVVYNVNNNIFKGALTGALNAVYKGVAGNVTGVIQGNIIGTPNGVDEGGTGVGGSAISTRGSAQGNGIFVAIDRTAGAGNLNYAVRIDSNQIADLHQANGGIAIRANSPNSGTGLIEATVVNNTIKDLGSQALAALYLQIGGTGSPPDNAVLGLDLKNNNFTVTSNQLAVVDIDQFPQPAHLNVPNYPAGNPTSGQSAGNALNTFWTTTNTNTFTNGGAPFGTYGAALNGVTHNAFTNPVPMLAVVPTVVPWEDDPANQPKIVVTSDQGEQPPITIATATDPGTGGALSSTGLSGGPAVVDASVLGHPTVVDDGVVSQDELNLIVAAAIQRWSDAGLTPDQLAAMRAVEVTVSDMMGLYVGASSAGQVHIDSDAAGYGWFVDSTPDGDSEFDGSGSRLIAAPGGPADHRIDLLTVVMHELGHQIGLDDTYAAGNFAELMYGYVNPGERRLPESGDAAGAVPGSLTHEEYAVGPISNVTDLPAGKAVDIIFDSQVDSFSNQVIPVFHNQATVSGTNLTTSPVTSNTEDLIVDTLTLGDKIFLDVNANGIFDAGDTPLVGVTLTLYADSNGNGVLDGAELTNVLATATTNASGIYSFSSLAAGDYVVSIDASNFTGGGALVGKIPTSGGTDPDDNVDNDNNGVAGPGGTVINAPIRLDFNQEPTAGTGNDTNNTLDFGFLNPNSPPAFTGLDGTPSFTEGGAAVVLDNNATVSDPNLTGTNYAGASLTLARSGGAVAEDVFGTSGTLSFSAPGSGNVLVGATTVGTFTQSGGTLVITFNSNATQALVNSTLQQLTYVNSSDNPPASAVIGYDFSDGNTGGAQGSGGVLHATGSVTVSITGVDDPTVANDDNSATPENASVIIAVLANDSDPDGPPLAVAKVNGTAISVGSPVTLPSGAIVSLNNDGTLTYDPNGQYNTLTSTASGETGAVNTFAPDSFTYTLSGSPQPTATVNVTVNGVVSPQDHLEGDAGNNTITGTPSGDFFDLSQGGNDTASGLGANDGFFFGAAFTAADTVDGGGGGNDQIGLQGNYSGGNALVLGANTITNVEALVLLPGVGFNYDITTNDGNVAAGGLLKVQATQLGVGESFHFDGSNEHDGSFLVFGHEGSDVVTGGDGNDGFYFGPNGFESGDIVDGGPGSNDQLGLDGNYGAFGPAFELSGGDITNVEVVVLLPGPSGSPNTFNLITNDTLVASGQSLTIFGVQVTTNIAFDGSNEHDGAFKFYGGSGSDNFIGSDGNDWIFGGGGGDLLTGGAGSDTFYYDDASQSTSVGYDKIFNFDDSSDTIDLPFAVTGFAAPASGNLSTASFDSDLSAAFSGLTSHQAGMFTATGGDLNGHTFLVIDADGNAGYQAGSDYVIEIVTPVTPVDNPAIFV